MGAALLLAALILSPALPPAMAAPPESNQTPVVTVLKVPEKEVNPAQDFVGRVEALQTVDLRARVEGYIKRVAFQEGAQVKAGELLFQLDQAPYLAEVAEAKAKVALAQAAFDKAEQYIKRLKAVRSGGVAATDMDTALAAQATARAQLQEAQAVLQKEELNLGYTSIHAPISGRIGRAAYTLGNLVGHTSEPLARIVQLDPIRVVYSMGENEYVADKIKAQAKPNQPPAALVPHLLLPDGSRYPLAGRIDFTDPQVDPGTGTIAVRAIFDNPGAVLLPGQYVTMLISRRLARRLPVVPQSAVMEDREGLYVLLVDKESKVKVRRITRGAVVGTGWAVESGLGPGETIIVHGLQKVSPGQVVRTVQSDEK